MTDSSSARLEGGGMSGFIVRRPKTGNKRDVARPVIRPPGNSTGVREPLIAFSSRNKRKARAEKCSSDDRSTVKDFACYEGTLALKREFCSTMRLRLGARQG